jgi:hypothetical protein
VFAGSFAGTGYGIFGDFGSGLTSIVRSDGANLPGTNGTINTTFSTSVVLNDSNAYMFSSGYGTGATAGGGIFTNLTGSLTAVALTNPATPVPGVPANFTGLQTTVVSFGGNTIGLQASDSANQTGNYRFQAGQLSTTVRTGDAFFGDPQRVYSLLNYPVSTNNQGVSAFAADSQIPNNPSSILVHIITSSSSQTNEVIRSGSLAPGTTLPITNFGQWVQTDQLGDVSFYASYGNGTPVTGLFAKYGNNVLDIARPDGPLAPGTSGHFSFPGLASGIAPVAMNNGRILFFAATTTADNGLWMFNEGSLAKIVLASDHAPDSGLLINTIQHYAIDAAGDVAFTSLAVNGRPCLFYYDSVSGTIRTLIVSGQTWDLDGIPGGQTRVVQDVSFPTGDQTSGADGFGSAFNDNGQLLINIDFANQTNGLYIVSVPEPNVYLLCGMVVISGAGLGWVRWRKTRRTEDAVI